MKIVLYTLILFPMLFSAQNSKELRIEIREDSSKVKSTFFDDGILAKRVWLGSNSRADSLKTYYKSGKLNEVFYHDEYGRLLKGQQFNAKGELLTSWKFKNASVQERIDHKIEYNYKNKTNIINAHAILKKSNDALLKNPKNIKSLYHRAISRYILGNYMLALRDFHIVLKRINEIEKKKNIKAPNKTMAAIYDYIASIYSSYEMENHVIHYRIKAIHTSPDESRLYYNLGAYLTSIKEYKLSIGYLNKAIEMVPKHGFAHWLLGITYSDLEENKKALEYINIAFQHEAGIYKRSKGTAERDLRTTRGLLYHRLGKSEKGIADLEEALNINEDNSFALRNLGVIYHDLGNYDKSCDLLRKAKDLGYEKIYDRNDLQKYLEASCNNKTNVKTHHNLKKPFISPNPTKSNIKIENLDFNNIEYSLFDFELKLIKTGILQKNESIDLSELPSGLYILKTNSEEQHHIFKIIKE